MADRYLNESGGTNGFTLEEGGGVLILEIVTVVFRKTLSPVGTKTGARQTQE